MRSYCSLYVDVGYLLAAAATRVTGTSLRKGIHVEYPRLIDALIRQSEQISGLPCLRVHWYDSAKDGVPDAQQERIGELPKVKLRLGRFGVDGQQKGVDLRIGLDMVAHARNQAADAFLLVSGDDDLTEAVEEAQANGVQVSLLAVPTSDERPQSVSRHLMRAADAIDMIAPSTIDKHVMKVEVPKPQPMPSPSGSESPGSTTVKVTPKDLAALGRQSPTATPAAVAYSTTTGDSPRVAAGYAEADEYDDEIDAVVDNVLESFRQSATPEAKAELVNGRPSIPRDLDRALLLDLSNALGLYDLPDPVRFRLRDRFWERLDGNGQQ